MTNFWYSTRKGEPSCDRPTVVGVELPDVIDQLRPSIVQISATVRPNTDEHRARLGGKLFRSQPMGTGFFVSESAHVVTAQHVISGARRVAAEWAGSEVSVGIGLAVPNSENMRANFIVIGFDIVEEDERHDLALLRMLANPFKGEVRPMIRMGDQEIGAMYGIPAMNPDRPRDGAPIVISGYPLGESVLVSNAGMVASSWSVTVDDMPHPSFPDMTMPEMRDTYLADVQTNPGNSGGPVYSTQDGRVIGVLVAGKLTNVVAGEEPVFVNGVPVSADAGLSVVVPAKYCIEMLERHGVEWRTAGEWAARGRPTPGS
ncbi:MAG: S1 family peptidase [Solirubrobacteraceae bacterium]